MLFKPNPILAVRQYCLDTLISAAARHTCIVCDGENGLFLFSNSDILFSLFKRVSLCLPLHYLEHNNKAQSGSIHHHSCTYNILDIFCLQTALCLRANAALESTRKRQQSQEKGHKVFCVIRRSSSWPRGGGECQRTVPGRRGKSGTGRRRAWSTRRTSQPGPKTPCRPVIRPHEGTRAPVGATPAEVELPGSQAGTVGPPPVKTQVGSLRAGTTN